MITMMTMLTMASMIMMTVMRMMDEIIGPEASAIVMSAGQKDPQSWSVHLRDQDAEEKLLDRFRDPADPLQFDIVTSKLSDASTES
jgi:hypothetical protein